MIRRVALTLIALGCSTLAFAADSRFHVDDLGDATRIRLEGSFANSYYTVVRGDHAEGPFTPLTESSTLCLGECAIIDHDALRGATYWYRFDVIAPDGTFLQFGPAALTIGQPLDGMSAIALPSPLRGRGVIRVTAAFAAGARAGNAASATELPGEITLFDVRGRVARRLFRGTLDRLTFDLAWDGTDDTGRRLAPGLYFLAFRAGERRTISRVTLLD